jgi:hypothetical protein
MSDKKIVRRYDQVDEKQLLEIILSNGSLEVSVDKKIDPVIRPGQSE